MLELHAFAEHPLCEGYTWVITDERALAEVVAWLILGEHLHARDILAALSRDHPAMRDRFLDRRIAELRRTPATNEERWHRDGWVFQMLSWVAAQLGARELGENRVLVRAPQARKADKGIDNLLVTVPSDGDPGHITIGEDKATARARRTVREEVWPEFRAFEAEERDNEVATEVQALLEHLPEPERRSVVDAVMRRERWRYRVAITIGVKHDGPAGRARLFAGFDEVVVGDPAGRRRAETVLVDDVRAWMDRFVALVAGALEEARRMASV